MSRQVWAAIACLVVIALGVGGIAFNGDIYDTRSPIYGLVKRITPQDDYQRAEDYARMMRAQDLDGLKRESVLPLAPNFSSLVTQVADTYPPTEPIASAPIRYSLAASSDGRRSATVVINHRYADGSAIFTTTVLDKTTNKVQMFTLSKYSAANIAALRLDPLNANGTQDFTLFAASIVFMFTLVTLYACLAAKGVKWKWLWFFFITAGVTGLRFNWMTQALSFALIDIRWGAAGYFQNLFEPAYIYINFPVGALLFWLTRGKPKPANFIQSAA